MRCRVRTRAKGRGVGDLYAGLVRGRCHEWLCVLCCECARISGWRDTLGPLLASALTAFVVPQPLTRIADRKVTRVWRVLLPERTCSLSAGFGRWRCRSSVGIDARRPGERDHSLCRPMPGPEVTMSIVLPPHHRSHLRAARRCLAPASSTRYRLLAPPSRLAPGEAAALLRLPRRVLRADLEWFMTGLGETTGQARLELRA